MCANIVVILIYRKIQNTRRFRYTIIFHSIVSYLYFSVFIILVSSNLKKIANLMIVNTESCTPSVPIFYIHTIQPGSPLFWEVQFFWPLHKLILNIYSKWCIDISVAIFYSDPLFQGTYFDVLFRKWRPVHINRAARVNQASSLFLANCYSP
jgi:hypothetical protein